MQHAAPQPVQARSANGLGIAAFVTSLVSLVVCCGLLSPISLILGIVAALKRPRGFAIAGIVLSIVGVLLLLAVSLLPLLVIGVAGGIAASIGLGAAMTQLQGAAIAKNIDEYIRDRGSVPASLASVPELDQSMIEDPWGNAFIYRPDPTNDTYELKSAGPDGLPDTGDDIVIDTELISNAMQGGSGGLRGQGSPTPGAANGANSSDSPNDPSPLNN
jgi:hypothetical protein